MYKFISKNDTENKSDKIKEYIIIFEYIVIILLLIAIIIKLLV